MCSKLRTAGIYSGKLQTVASMIQERERDGLTYTQAKASPPHRPEREETSMLCWRGALNVLNALNVPRIDRCLTIEISNRLKKKEVAGKIQSNKQNFSVKHRPVCAFIAHYSRLARFCSKNNFSLRRCRPACRCRKWLNNIESAYSAKCQAAIVRPPYH